MPAGAAARARGSLGTCHPRGAAGIPAQNKQVPPPSSRLSLPCFLWILGRSALIPLAQPGRVWLCSPKSFPQPPAAPFHPRRVPSLLPALLCFPGLKLKEKQLPTSIPGKLQTPGKPGMGLRAAATASKEDFFFLGENRISLGKSSPSNHVIRRGKRLPRLEWGEEPEKRIVHTAR